MAFREVPVFEVREVLRLWLGGEGIRAIARLSRVDRKTVRRYVDAAIEAGVTVDGGVEQLDDLTLGRVVEIVRPHRSDGHGHAWAALVATRDTIEAWVAGGVAGVKICELLEHPPVGRKRADPTTLRAFPAPRSPCGPCRDPRQGVRSHVSAGRSPRHADRPADGRAGGRALRARHGHVGRATPRSTTCTSPRDATVRPCRPCPTRRTRPRCAPCTCR